MPNGEEGYGFQSESDIGKVVATFPVKRSVLAMKFAVSVCASVLVGGNELWLRLVLQVLQYVFKVHSFQYLQHVCALSVSVSVVG